MNAPDMRLAAAAAPAVGLGSLAQSIAGVGDAFQSVADQTQKSENARMEAEFRTKLAADYSTLQADLDKDPDPKNRITKTEAFFMEHRSDSDRPEIPPIVRDNLRQHFSDFASRGMTTAAAQSASLADKRARLALGNEMKAATARGNRDEFTLALGTAEENGLILPEEKDKYLSDFERTTTGTALDLAIQEEPDLVIEDLDRPDFLTRFPGLAQSDIPRLKDAARVSAQRKRGEEMDLMDAALSQNKLEPKDIEAAMFLTPADRVKMTKALDNVQNAKPPTSEQHGKAWDVLLSLRKSFTDPSISDKDYAATWNDDRAEVLSLVATVPPAFREDISAGLSRWSPANRSAAKTKPKGYSEAPELKAIGLDRITRARGAGMFGNVGDDADPATKEKAYRRSEDLRLQVSRFVEKNPEATMEEVTTFTDGLISGDRVKTSASELQSFVPGGAQRLRPMIPLPDMAPGQGSASDALLPPRTQLENFLK